MDAAATAESLRAMLPYLRGRSPLYERLTAGLAGAAERGFDGGVLGRLLEQRGADAVPETRLLVMAWLHHTALADPSLPHAAWFSASDHGRLRDPDEGAPAALCLAHLVERETDATAFVTAHRLQTNEVGRCAVLLVGFLRAAAFGLPLRLIELGTSAGLNLRFDRYRYRYADGPAWGPSGGPVIHTRAEGRAPRSLAPPSLDVAERIGVDLDPIDPATPEGVRLLHSFVWPDEPRRHRHLDEAIRVAQGTPVTLVAGDLLDWADGNAGSREGTATVLFHSQVRHLLTGDQTARLGDVAERALRSASATAPLVHLAFETPRGQDHLAGVHPELTIGIGDGSGPPRWHTLAAADWHGRWVRWL